MSNQQTAFENDERLDEELKRYDKLRTSMVTEEEESYWYDPEIIKDISEGVQNKLIGVVIICCIFIVLEAIGAYISDSVAIFTDVAHLFSDLIGFIISLTSVSLAKREASLKHSYGYIRAESVGALFSVVIIWGLTIWILVKSIDKLINRDYESLNPTYMLGSAVLGLFVNIIMAIYLHGHGHDHHHDHGHDHSHGHAHNGHHHHDKEGHQDSKKRTKKDKKDNNQKEEQQIKEDEKNTHGHDDANDPRQDEEAKLLDKPKNNKHKQKDNLSLVTANQSHNIQAAWMHILGDLLQSIGVVIFAVIIFFRQDWKFLDPIISIIFVIIAASFSIPVAKGIITIMLDATPDGLDIERFIITLESISHVREIHDLHVWNLTHGKPAMTAHILVDDRVEYVLKKATIECRKIGIYHTTIQVERIHDVHQINCEHNIH